MQLFCNWDLKTYCSYSWSSWSLTVLPADMEALGVFYFSNWTKNLIQLAIATLKLNGRSRAVIWRGKKEIGDLKDWMKSNKCFNLLNVMITGDLSAQCHYCTHYSSAIIVASYLVRMEPFSQTFLHLQVNFSPVWPGSITSHYCYKNSNQ